MYSRIMDGLPEAIHIEMLNLFVYKTRGNLLTKSKVNIVK